MVHAHTAAQPVAETVVTAAVTETVAARLELVIVVLRSRCDVGGDWAARESIGPVGLKMETGAEQRRTSSWRSPTMRQKSNWRVPWRLVWCPARSLG